MQVYRPVCLDNRCFGPLPRSEDLEHLKRLGFSIIVSLIEDDEYVHAGYTPEDLKNKGFRVLRIPTPDKRSPSLLQIVYSYRKLSHDIETHNRILYHCFGGVGRSPTLLATHLVLEGLSHSEAISRIRSLMRNAIETKEQSKTVERIYHILTAFKPYSIIEVFDFVEHLDVNTPDVRVVDRKMNAIFDIMLCLRNLLGVMIYDLKAVVLYVYVSHKLVSVDSLRIDWKTRSIIDMLIDNIYPDRFAKTIHCVHTLIESLGNYEYLSYVNCSVRDKVKIVIYSYRKELRPSPNDVIKELSNILNREVIVELRTWI